MTLHWLDGFRALGQPAVWKYGFHHPLVAVAFLALLIAVAARDCLLWICMGDRYLEED